MNINLANSKDNKGWEVGKLGLTVHSNLSFEQCRVMVDTLATIDTSIKFALADALIYAKGRFGEKYADLVDELKFSMGYLYNLIYVANRVPPDNRGFDLSYSHFYEVASVTDSDEQREWLQLCVKNRWSREDLRLRMKGNLIEPRAGDFVMPVNDRSALQTVIAWLDGRYPISKSELRNLLEEYLHEDRNISKAN